MQITQTDPATGVITLSGDVGARDVPALRHALVTAVDGLDNDLLIDTHGVSTFADDAFPALTAARSRAKWQRHGIAVLGNVGSPMELALRRTGYLMRIPIHPDGRTARACFADQRAIRDRRRVGAGGRPCGSSG